MAVNLVAPRDLSPVAGLTLASARAIKSRHRDDLTVVAIDAGAAVCGMFTQNRFAAAPVQVCRVHLRRGGIRGLAINAGIANAGTSDGGLQDARESCRLLGRLLGCSAARILPFSTGVIMERLPMKKYGAGLRRCVQQLRPDGWGRAAHAIMTTDTVAKGISFRAGEGGEHTVTGIAKGSGMIHPDMATLLAFVATDAEIDAATLARWQRQIAIDSFNAISVDGDTSTNDSFVFIATGKTGRPKNRAQLAAVKAALRRASAKLAEFVVRDGEGAQKLIKIFVQGGDSKAVCRRVANAVATSPLVKTALAAGDANVGRLLMAIGNVGRGFNPAKVSLFLGDAPVIAGGGTHPQYGEKQAARELAKDEVRINIHLGGTKHWAEVMTCDLTHRYIEINAEYRS